MCVPTVTIFILYYYTTMDFRGTGGGFAQSLVFSRYLTTTSLYISRSWRSYILYGRWSWWPKLTSHTLILLCICVRPRFHIGLQYFRLVNRSWNSCGCSAHVLHITSNIVRRQLCIYVTCVQYVFYLTIQRGVCVCVCTKPSTMNTTILICTDVYNVIYKWALVEISLTKGNDLSISIFNFLWWWFIHFNQFFLVCL